MKLFQLVQKYYRAIGVHPSPADSMCPFNLHNSWFLLMTSALFASTITSFVLQSTTIMDYAESFYIFSTVLASMISFSESIGNGEKTFAFIEEIEEYIQKKSQSVSTEAVLVYSKLIGNIELMSKVLRFVLVELTVVGCFFPALVITLVNYFLFDLADESYFLSFPICLPFNWKTPSGYLMASIFILTTASATLLCVVPTACFAIGFAWIATQFVEENIADVHALNEMTRNSHTNHILLIHSFGKIVRDFSDMKELSAQSSASHPLTVQYSSFVSLGFRFFKGFNGIIEISITDVFIWSLLTICSSLLSFQFELSDQNLNKIEIVRILFLVFWSFVLILCASEFGEMLSERFNSLDDALGECDWYLFPMEMQQMFITLLASTQQPTNVQGFGNVLCNRETFSKTIQAGFSYFMTFRQMGS